VYIFLQVVKVFQKATGFKRLGFKIFNLCLQKTLELVNQVFFAYKCIYMVYANSLLLNVYKKVELTTRIVFF
jgi:hypothetical protein